jgi:hypothetical protein
MVHAGIMGLQISVRESGDVTIVDLEGRAVIGVDNDLLSSNPARSGTGGAGAGLLVRQYPHF